MAAQQLKYELPALLATSIREPLPEAAVEQYLASPPFIPVPHALNLRTLSSPHLLAPNRIFRSGALGHLPASVLGTLRTTYNITTIYDLRSRREREWNPSPDIEGVETIWIPSTSDISGAALPSGDAEAVEKPKQVISDTKPADVVEKNGQVVSVKIDQNVLKLYKEAYRAVFQRLMEPDTGNVLFHCTAGKDRTGMLAALILALVGASEEEIEADYALSRIGIEPFRTQLTGQLLKMMGMSEEEGLRDPAVEERCSVRGPTILAALRSMDEKWGEGQVGKYPGVENYMRQQLKFSDEELDKIRSSLKQAVKP